MGVPALFRTIVSNFPNVLESQPQQDIDILCFDFNCLIHFCKGRVSLDQTNTRNQEETLIIEVVSYMIEICETIKPKTIYISMDGCVPYAKMKQQRARRFMAKLKHESQAFDSNKISPGTAFMSKLSARIKNFMTVGWTKRRTRCYFSDANVPGEGEAKIMKFLSQQKESNVIIYGLDADLIILSMLQTNHKIRLMREASDASHASHASEERAFDYLNINQLKKVILNTYVIPVSKDPEDFFKDFAALSCLGGNDFVEALPHCKIKDKGFDRLMDAYIKANKPLVKGGVLQHDTLTCILKELSQTEEEVLTRTYNKIFHNKDHIQPEEYEHAYFTNPNHPKYHEYKHVYQAIDFCKPYKWWNTYYFSEAELSDVCYEYIRSIQWCMHYYYNATPPSWMYVYPYDNAPLIKDLVQHIPSHVPDVCDKTEPLFPLEQLFYIMPPSSAGLFPKNYIPFLNDPKSPIHSYYPRKIELNVIKGHKQIYTEPKFNKDLMSQKEIIRTILVKVPITQYEANRNMIRNEPFFKFV